MVQSTWAEVVFGKANLEESCAHMVQYVLWAWQLASGAGQRLWLRTGPYLGLFMGSDFKRGKLYAAAVFPMENFFIP
jgi:hypothetical protein